jgi:hypothetical protein
VIGASAAWRAPARGELGAVGQPPKGGPEWSPAARALLRPPPCVSPKTRRGPNWSARSRRKGCIRPSRSTAATYVRSAADAGRRAVRDRDRRSGLHRRRAERDPGQRDQAAALVRVPPRRERGGVGAAAPIAGAAKRRCAGAAKFFSARLARGLFLLCAHGREAIMSAHGSAEDMKRS